MNAMHNFMDSYYRDMRNGIGIDANLGEKEEDPGPQDPRDPGYVDTRSHKGRSCNLSQYFTALGPLEALGAEILITENSFWCH